MEILKKKLLKVQNTIQNVENNTFSFLNAMFHILSKCDTQILDLCETVIYKINLKKTFVNFKLCNIM